jgi:hypothetical protein
MQERGEDCLGQILGRNRQGGSILVRRPKKIGQPTGRVDIGETINQGLDELGNNLLADRRFAEMPAATPAWDFEPIASTVAPSFYSVGNWHTRCRPHLLTGSHNRKSLLMERRLPGGIGSI